MGERTDPGHREHRGRQEARILETRNLLVVRRGRAGRPGFRVRPAPILLSRGEIAVLTGGNGTGKTTTLACLAGLIPPLAGEVLIRGQGLYGTFGARTALRREVAFVAAEPYLFRGSLLDNVTYGLRSRGVSRAESKKRGLEALDQAGLADLADRPARALSTGQIRRVAVLRAVIIEPSLLLLDEPDGDLDAPGKHWLLETIRDVSARSAVLLTTHVAGDLAGLAHREIPVDPDVQ